VLGLATFSTAMSGFGFIGGPGLVYRLGTTSLWMTFAAALGIPLSFLLAGRRLHALAGSDVLTLPDAVHKRSFYALTSGGGMGRITADVAQADQARVAAGDLPPLAFADQAAPVFPGTYTPSWLAGIAFAGLMSAILSTASIFLNVGSATLTRDLPLALNRPLKHPIFWARVWTAVLALAAGALALWSRELVALLGAIGFGLHAAALVPTLVLGLRWPRATGAGVVASATVAVAGSGYFFVAQQLGFAATHGSWVPAHGFPSVGLVVLVSLITFVVASFLSQPAEVIDHVDARIVVTRGRESDVVGTAPPAASLPPASTSR
jgi:Na+/proline symporter